MDYTVFWRIFFIRQPISKQNQHSIASTFCLPISKDISNYIDLGSNRLRTWNSFRSPRSKLNTQKTIARNVVTSAYPMVTFSGRSNLADGPFRLNHYDNNLGYYKNSFPSSIAVLNSKNLSVDLGLKVHKIEIFFYSDFGICIISLLFMSKY
jgi:hypothetical protein